MTDEERAEDERLQREIADEERASRMEIGAPIATHRVELGDDAAAQTSALEAPEPEEAPTRDHLGDIDPTSGSVFGPDDPSEASTDPADYETDYADAMAVHAPQPLARDDMEPLGDVSGPGPHEGQMWAPSGMPESGEERFGRLGVGGDFAAQIPGAEMAGLDAMDPNAETFGEATDQDAAYAGAMEEPGASALASPYADEPEATDDPAEEAAEADAETTPETLGLEQMDAKRGEPLPPPGERLDEGLPSEGDIAQADALDPLHHLFHAFGAGLTAAGGGTPSAYVDRGDAARRERSAGMRERLGLKAEDRADAASAEQEATQAAGAADRAERGLAIRDRQATAAERASEQRGGLVEAQTERTRVQTEAEQLATQFSRATREERQSAGSGLSRGYQEAVRTRAELTSVDPPDGFEAMSAEQLEPVLRAMSQGVGVRRGRGGAGGSIESLRARAVAHGVDAADAAVLPAADLRREIGEDTGPTARAAHDRAGGGSRVTVWENAEGNPVTASPDAFSTPTEERTYRNALEDAGRISTLLDAIDSAYREAGGGATLGSRTQAAAVLSANGAIQQPIGSMLGAISDYLTHTGVVNPGGEAERLMGMLPNPTSTRQIVTGSYDAQAAQFRGTIADMVRRDARQRGVSDADTARLLREIGLGAHTAGAHARHTSPRAPARAPASAPTADPSSMSDDEIRAELRALEGG